MILTAASIDALSGVKRAYTNFQYRVYQPRQDVLRLRANLRSFLNMFLCGTTTHILRFGVIAFREEMRGMYCLRNLSRKSCALRFRRTTALPYKLLRQLYTLSRSVHLTDYPKRRNDVTWQDVQHFRVVAPGGEVSYLSSYLEWLGELPVKMGNQMWLMQNQRDSQ